MNEQQWPAGYPSRQGDPTNPFPYGSRDLYSKIYGDEYVQGLDRQAELERRKAQAAYRAKVEAEQRARQAELQQRRAQGPYGAQQYGPYGPRPPYRGAMYRNPYYDAEPVIPPVRHNVALHVLLFLVTGGIGNLVYWAWIVSENRRRGY